MATKDDIIRAIEEDEKSTQDVGKAQFYSESSSTPADAQPTVDKPQLETVAPALPAQKKAVDKALKMKPAEIKAPTIEDIIRKTEPKRQLSEEDEAIIKRRANREALIGAISDGLSAMANIYFTGQGTKSAYDASSNLAPRAKKRWDDWMAQRNAEMERNYQDYQVKERERKAEERAKKAAEYAAAKDERDYRLNQQKVENDRVANTLRAQEIANLANYRATQNQFKQANLDLKKISEANRTALAWGKINAAKSGQKIPIQVSEDEYIEVNADRLKNDASVASLFRMLPAEVQKTAGKPKYDKYGKLVGYYEPTKAEMLRAIGDNAPINEQLRNALLQAPKKPSPTAGVTPKKPSPTR